ncbi:PREDICTED: kinesin-like protein KIN-12F [Camelina sativa]|uniref:Kinesin-like protein KIN-12F n=1 Tax=Camelina sativa TaxID=90675 RepID=A0ABM0XAB3_CAMSA|nr:PREDICTED: kinesin-like protein KIN-12F [Camelina sativa]
MKSPAKIGENRFLGNISTSSIRNLLPRSISAKQKSIQNSDSKSFRSNDENAPPCDPNIQTTNHHHHHLNYNNNNNNNDLQLKKKSPQKVLFPSATHQVEAKSVLVPRTNSMVNEITEEDDDSLGDQIRELKEELVRTKSDGFKPDGSNFVRESLSQLRNSINKSSLVMSCANNNKQGSEKETMYEADDDEDDGDVMELSKHINKFHSYCDSEDLRDSLQSSFASASGCEAESMSGDDICSVDKHKYCALDHSVPNTVGNGISISLPHQTRILEEPPLSESPKIRNFRKSVAASTKFQATPRNVNEISDIGNKNVQQFGPSMSSKKHLSPTDSLAASLQRGLHIIDCHQRSSLSNRSSVSFSFGHLSLKPCDESDNLSASVKLLQENRPKEGGSSILLCLSCRQKLDQEAEGGYKAIEEACADEKHLKNMCVEQATKIEQLTSLLDQYKKNTVQESSKLMKSDDGEDETEVVKETYETNQSSEGFGKVRIDLSEKEALLKEIAELKSKLQPTKSTDNLRSSLLLRSFQMRKSTDFTKNTENNNDVLEEERERWTEMESEWISLTDELRMDIDSHRSHAEDLEIELRKEKMATEELNDAISRAMLGHSRLIEQYTELQEKYDELAERHSVTMAGIVDVKKAAAKAALKGRHGKRFAKAFSAELTAIRAEKEKEREFLKKENKALKIQLRDTVEAVQAAGELLVRLREAEQAVQSSEERFSSIEEENDKLKNQMEKLKSKHKTEMSTMKQYLAETKLPGSALKPWFKENEQKPWFKENEQEVEEEEHVTSSENRTGVVSYDDYTDDQAWRAEFGAIYQDHDHY